MHNRSYVSSGGAHRNGIVKPKEVSDLVCIFSESHEFHDFMVPSLLADMPWDIPVFISCSNRAVVKTK